MRPRLAIFDFDGTLADTGPWLHGLLDDAAVRFGFRRVDAAEAEALRDLSAREILRALEIPWRKLPAIAAYVRQRAAADADQHRLFPGVPELLAELAEAQVAVAIVSSNAEPTIRHVLGPALSAQVAVVEGGASLFGKPARLRAALRRTGHAARHAIAIGDEVRDLDAARKVGLATAAVTWGFASASALRRAGATYVFDDLDALRAGLLGAA